MILNEILEVGKVLIIIISVSLFFYFYFRRQGFRNIVNRLLVFLPGITKFVSSRIEDKKGEFDLHDLGEVLGRVAKKSYATIQDPTNVSFDDVRDEVFEIVRAELANYQNLPGVPSLDDPSLEELVRITFENIKRVSGENSTGNSSSNQTTC